MYAILGILSYDFNKLTMLYRPYTCRGGRGKLGKGRTGTPLITTVVFSQSVSRKRFYVALSCLHHISLQNQIADNFVSTVTKQGFLKQKVVFLPLRKCVRQVAYVGIAPHLPSSLAPVGFSEFPERS